MCNKLIKFGCFEQQVGRHFDFTATGHYATTVLQNGKTWLGTALDPVKDQTDFLAQIDYLQVSKLMFPLGGLMKQEVRDIALKAQLPSARRRDSQGICFLGRIIIMTLSVVSSEKRKAGLLSWKRERYWVRIAVIGFILSVSVKAWA